MAALLLAAVRPDEPEVKSVGGKVSTVRTADQTEIARFWFEGPGAWNTIARTVAVSRGLDARDSARLLALTNLAMADAYIVSDYPSTQSTFSGAAAVVLASVLGGDRAKFTVTSGKRGQLPTNATRRPSLQER